MAPAKITFVNTIKLSTIVGIVLVSTAQAHTSAIDVCNLIQSPQRYDRKTVIVVGFVFADIHFTGIEGEKCQGGVVLGYPNSAPKDFISGVEGVRGRLDPRPFKVTVKGKFYARVRGPLGYLRRIEVTKVLSWEYVGDNTTAN